MRLINVNTLQMEEFAVPPKSYAVLSHVWGMADDEVSYQVFQDTSQREGKPGFAKIKATCERAKDNELGYA